MDKKLEVICIAEYDDEKQRDTAENVEKKLKGKGYRMPTPGDLFWMWKQGEKIESKYRPFWVRMPDGSAVPGSYGDFGDVNRFGASLGLDGDRRDFVRFGGVGVRDASEVSVQKARNACAKCGWKRAEPATPTQKECKDDVGIPATEEEKETLAKIRGWDVESSMLQALRAHVKREVEKALKDHLRIGSPEMKLLIEAERAKPVDIEEIKKVAADEAMGELRHLLNAANAIGCDWVAEYIDARHPGAKKEALKMAKITCPHCAGQIEIFTADMTDGDCRKDLCDHCEKEFQYTARMCIEVEKIKEGMEC